MTRAAELAVGGKSHRVRGAGAGVPPPRRAPSLPLDGVLARAVAERAAHSGAVLQRYFVREYWFSKWRQADDMTAATKIQTGGTSNHELYARDGKAAQANTVLAAVGSQIRLVQTGKRDTFKKGRTTVELYKVEAHNTLNNTSGEGLRLWADCGKAAAAIVGNTARQAVYADGVARAVARFTDPTLMKIEIMKVWLADEWMRQRALGTEEARSDANKIRACRKKGRAREDELPEIRQRLTDAAGNTLVEKAIRRELTAKYNEIAEAYFEYYNGKSEAARDAIDKVLKINAYASPGVGQGYTTSSGGASYADTSTWNFHWGGVVMTSDDGTDKVVLENYSVSRPDEQNERWTFELYGTKTAQTFHARHKATRQHGQAPTTMVIEKQ